MTLSSVAWGMSALYAPWCEFSHFLMVCVVRIVLVLMHHALQTHIEVLVGPWQTECYILSAAWVQSCDQCTACCVDVTHNSLRPHNQPSTPTSMPVRMAPASELAAIASHLLGTTTAVQVIWKSAKTHRANSYTQMLSASTPAASASMPNPPKPRPALNSACNSPTPSSTSSQSPSTGTPGSSSVTSPICSGNL